MQIPYKVWKKLNLDTMKIHDTMVRQAVAIQSHKECVTKSISD